MKKNIFVVICLAALIIYFAVNHEKNDIKQFKFYSNSYSENGNNYSVLLAFGILKDGTKLWSPIVIVPEKNEKPVIGFDGFNFSLKINGSEIPVSNNNIYLLNSIGGFDIYPAPKVFEMDEQKAFSAAKNLLNSL